MKILSKNRIPVTLALLMAVLLPVRGPVVHAESAGLCYEGTDRNKIYYVYEGTRAKEEWKTTGGATYYFGKDGYAYRDGVYQIDSRWYAFRADGTQIKSGWTEADQERFYVMKNGYLATGDLMIGGKWYYFDRETSVMQTGIIRTKTGFQLYGSDGSWTGEAKDNGWNQIGGDWYYLEQGETVTGDKTIGGKEYHFDGSGKMETSTILNTDSGLRLIGKDGKPVKSGWFLLDGNWYYVDPETGCCVTGGQRTIGGKKYLFDVQGVMQTVDGIYDSRVYSFNTDGSVKTAKSFANGWTLSGGVYYYYKNGKPYTGWVGNYYISEGRMLRNTETPDGYYVGSNGAARTSAGWIRITDASGERWVYAGKGGKLVKKNWLLLNKKYYYLGGENGYTMVTGLQKIGSKWYIFSDGGVYLKEVGSTLPAGWLQVGQDWYYCKYGEPVNGRITLSGKIYTFVEGRLVTGGFSEIEEDRSYYSNADGQAVEYRGWVRIDGKWFYFGKDGKAVLEGWINDGGKLYYATKDGILTGYRVVDGTLYQFDSNGVMVSAVSPQNGWKYAGGSYFFFENGRALAGQLVSDSGYTYLLDQDGRLVNNKEVDGYYANVSGVVVRNTWKKVGGVYHYYGSDGKRLEGVWKIDGQICYLD